MTLHVFYGSSIPFEKAVKQDPRRKMFLDSAAKYKITDLTNVNLGVPFDYLCVEVERRLISLLRKLDPMELVLITDAWDTFFCCGLERVERIFRKFGKPIVFSMETNLFPADTEKYGSFPKVESRWRYINGGQIIGYAKAIIDLYLTPGFWDRKVCWNNQEAWNRWWILHPESPDFALDTSCSLFCALHDNGKMRPRICDVVIVKAGQVYNSETQSYPCMVHGNGGFIAQAYALWKQLR